MAIDFNDPTTWDEPMIEEDALNIAIFAMNTMQHPDASSPEQLAAMDFFLEGAIEVLCKMRDDMDEETGA
jgi:hypothetical protein